MPMYEFECQECGKVIEVILSHSQKPPKTCDCGKKGKLVKLISAPAFQFKGSGWYVTDYGKGSGTDKKKESESSSSDSGSDSSSTDSTPAASDAKKDKKDKKAPKTD